MCSSLSRRGKTVVYSLNNFLVTCNSEKAELVASSPPSASDTSIMSDTAEDISMSEVELIEPLSCGTRTNQLLH